jgi:hypothetical protein
MVLTNELNNTLNKVNDNNYATRGLSLSSITELENIKLLTFKVTLAILLHIQNILPPHADFPGPKEF